MKHDYRHLSTKFDMDAWLDATDDLIPGSHSANDTPATRPFTHMIGPDGEYLLRQWPEGTPQKVIQRQAQVLATMNAAAGDVIPVMQPRPDDPETFTTTVKDRLYSAQTWLPGRPLGRYGGYVAPDGSAITLPLPESAHATDVISQVAGTIAKAHSASESIDKAGFAQATLAIELDRVRRFWFNERKVLGEKAADERDIRRWLRSGNRVIPTASDLIRNEINSFRDTSVVLHNDLWPENILITGQEENRTVTGIVGWRHMAAGSPVLDLAQLSVNMQGWSAALTESIIDSYSEHRELRPDQRRLIPAVAGLILVESVGKLLSLSYLDDGMIGHEATSVMRSGMKTLLDSLERVTQILAPDIDQTERFNRQRRDDRPGYTPKFHGQRNKSDRGRKDTRPKRKS